MMRVGRLLAHLPTLDEVRTYAKRQLEALPPALLGTDVARDKVSVISSAAFFAEAIQRVHGGESVTELLEF
jgi:hypothetical protein